jgi:hypothetical protein
MFSVTQFCGLRTVLRGVTRTVNQSPSTFSVTQPTIFSNRLNRQTSTMSADLTAGRLVVIGIPFPPEHRARFEPHFSSIAHFTSAKEVDRDALAQADVIYGQGHNIKSLDEIPNAKFVQISNAGVDDVLVHKFWKEDERAAKVPMATVAGIHMEPISQVLAPS